MVFLVILTSCDFTSDSPLVYFNPKDHSVYITHNEYYISGIDVHSHNDNCSFWRSVYEDLSPPNSECKKLSKIKLYENSKCYLPEGKKCDSLNKSDEICVHVYLNEKNVESHISAYYASFCFRIDTMSSISIYKSKPLRM